MYRRLIFIICTLILTACQTATATLQIVPTATVEPTITAPKKPAASATAKPTSTATPVPMETATKELNQNFDITKTDFGWLILDVNISDFHDEKMYDLWGGAKELTPNTKIGTTTDGNGIYAYCTAKITKDGVVLNVITAIFEWTGTYTKDEHLLHAYPEGTTWLLGNKASNWKTAPANPNNCEGPEGFISRIIGVGQSGQINVYLGVPSRNTEFASIMKSILTETSTLGYGTVLMNGNLYAILTGFSSVHK